MENICSVCKSADISLWYSGGAGRTHWASDAEWNVCRCVACGHQFVHPYPAQDVLDAHYANGYNPYQFGHGLSTEFDEIVQGARDSGSFRHVEISKGMRILDVGCGGGSFLAVCKALGAEVQGIEPSQDGVATCIEQGIPVFEGFLTDYHKEDRPTFDLITANHVVEHHPDPVALLGEMASLLAPGGKIWISVPNAGCKTSLLLQSQWHSADLPVHLQHFTKASVVRLVNEAGLRIRDMRTESENSLAGAYTKYLRTRFKIPSRLTKAVLRRPMAKEGWLGRKIDASGDGEAILCEVSLP